MTSPSPYGRPAAASFNPTNPLSPMNVGGMMFQPITSPAAVGFGYGSRRKATASWEDRFQELKQYKKENGDCLVPGRYKENPSLGRWVESQRKQYRQYLEAKETGAPNAGAMNDDRVALLEGIGFVWTLRKSSSNKSPGYHRSGLTWDQRLDQLRAYRDANGDCKVPHNYEQQLGRWVANQRTAYALYQQNKYSSLTQERIEALDAIGFSWTAPFKKNRKRKSSPSSKSARAPTSEQVYEAAWPMEYSAGGGNVGFMTPMEDDASAEEPATKKHKESDRAPIKKRDPRSKNDHSGAKAPRGDFGNKDTKRKVWNERFEELKEYKKVHGNCNVPGRYRENPSLGRWVETQRKQYHRYTKAKQEGKAEAYNYAIGMDEEERIAQLETVGFSWVVRGGRAKEKVDPSEKEKPLSWNERFEQLKAYKDANGDCFVPHNYPLNPKLGVWAANQRTMRRLYVQAKEEDQESAYSAVKEERIAALEALGFEWSSSRPRKRTVEKADSKSMPNETGGGKPQGARRTTVIRRLKR